jgi:hypothetical protein
MIPFNVLWYAPERMYYSCANMLNELFDSHEVTHHTGFGIDSHKEPPKIDGAVVVFHGGNEAAIGRGPALAAIMSAELMNYRWVLFISLGDEEDAFPLHLLAHKNFRVWTQTPKAGGQNAATADRYLIEGYHHDTRPILDSLPPHEKDLHWFFAGQVTHERRHRCMWALEASRDPFKTITKSDCGNAGREEFPITSILIKTKSFGAGLSHETYYEFMRRAAIIPCPAGPATPDSFRMAEALEAGCVPVLDAFSPDPHKAPGYWDLVFGEDHPFFVLESWENEWKPVMNEILHDYERHQRACQHFWRGYKLKFRQWLVKDMLSLGAL